MRTQLVLRAVILEDWKNQDKITIRWKVIDRQSEQVFYSETFTGEGKEQGNDLLDTGYNAIRESLDKVLADPSFVSTLTLVDKC